MTQDIRMLRGDWILESLTSILRNQAKWVPIPTKPTTSHNAPPGRFHPDTQTYWPEAREDSNPPGPRMMMIRIPKEPAIQYPGETLTLTPTLTRQIFDAFRTANVWNAVQDYARGDSTGSIAYYAPRLQKVVWGMHPTDLQTAALIASDYLDYAPHVAPNNTTNDNMLHTPLDNAKAYTPQS